MEKHYLNEVCELDHVGDVPDGVLTALRENQGHPVRHRCAACAYLAGLNEAADDVSGLIAQIQSLTSENDRLTKQLRELAAGSVDAAVRVPPGSQVGVEALP